jgi:phytoene desaturase
MKGYDVTIFEKNNYVGGKLSELKLNNFRFDKGPSLLTMPELIDELTLLTKSKQKFNYNKLDTITHYFYEDGTTLKAKANNEDFAQELHQKLGEEKSAIINYLKKCKYYYDCTSQLFLHQSLHKLKNFINFKTLIGVIKSPTLGLIKTMHQQNAGAFKNKKTTQLFNRYATYNGSNPYKAPALINIISHLEFGIGAYLPQNGMYQITEHLKSLALECGVTIKLNEHVSDILIENNKVTGLSSNDKTYLSDVVVSDVDIHLLYNKLLPKQYYPKKLLSQEKSSSAYVFYWGINKEFKELDLHNIFFSDDYKKEFNNIFNADSPSEDPTIYINITSKLCKQDAPNGCENWFVMINVPHNKHDRILYSKSLRENVVKKINRILNTDIESHIIEEAVLNPIDIEAQTSSFGGSLYGNSSNSKFSAFLRHSNFHKKIKGLYCVGGSVHPGGGIPLCLLSAKITDGLIETKN